MKTGLFPFGSHFIIIDNFKKKIFRLLSKTLKKIFKKFSHRGCFENIQFQIHRFSLFYIETNIVPVKIDGTIYVWIGTSF